MEVALVLFAIVYLAIILAGIVVALIWSRRRRYGLIKTTGVVLATLVIIYAVPFGDVTWGEVKKAQLCKEFGGTKIYQDVEDVDGFMWWESGGPGKPYTTHGYAFLEASNLKGEIFRYTKGADGTVDEHRVESSQARYVVRQYPHEKLGGHHSISKFVIIDRKENKILASNAHVAFDQGWMGFGSVVCPNERFNHIDFIHQVLRPRKLKE